MDQIRRFQYPFDRSPKTALNFEGHDISIILTFSCARVNLSPPFFGEGLVLWDF